MYTMYLLCILTIDTVPCHAMLYRALDFTKSLIYGINLPITYPAVLRQQVFSFDGRGAEGGSSSSASASASASPPLSADHLGAQHTVTRGLAVGGNTQKYPALVRSRGVPSHDYTNTYSNNTSNQNSGSSNSNIYSRR